jgi:hypothetical protein
MTAFTKQNLLNMIEIYQGFCCNGIKITSPIHAAAPELARQLLDCKAEVDRLCDICEKAEADYRGMSGTFKTYGLHASAKEAIETADYIKQVLDGEEAV